MNPRCSTITKPVSRDSRSVKIREKRSHSTNKYSASFVSLFVGVKILPIPKCG